MNRINQLLPARVQWTLATLLLLAGATLPMFSFSRFWIFNDSFSLVTGCWYLLTEGEWLLFLVIFGFSLLAPAYKQWLLFRLSSDLISAEKRSRALQKLHVLGKWSMADVLVVAVLAATIKLGGMASVSVHSGLYCFTAGVIISMLLTQRLAEPVQQP